MRGMKPDGREAEKVKAKKVKPCDQPTARELRRRRDLIWLYLDSLGMSSRDIERACLFANRSAVQIRSRLQACKRHHKIKSNA